MIITFCPNTIIEALEFDNLTDFQIMGQADGTTAIPVNLSCSSQRIILKRKKMTSEPFSFKSQWKLGNTTR